MDPGLWGPLLCAEGTGRVSRGEASLEKETENRKAGPGKTERGLSLACLWSGTPRTCVPGDRRWCSSLQGPL